MDRNMYSQEDGRSERVDRVLKRVRLALAAIATPLALGGASCAALESMGGGEPQADTECFDPAGLVGKLDGAGYRGQEDADVTIELSNDNHLQMKSGTNFEVVNAERAQPTLNPDGESSSYSVLTVVIENDTHSISEASVRAGWVDIEGFDSREIDEMTLCQIENEAPVDSELVVMAGSKQD